MTINVRTSATLPVEEDTLIGKPPSCLRLGHPLASSTNHAFGYLLSGLLHLQQQTEMLQWTGIARMMVWRHPNCEYIDVLIHIDGYFTTGPWILEVTAGTGATVTLNSTLPTAAFDLHGVFLVRAPWDAADAGYEEIIVEVDNCTIRRMMITGVPREQLAYSDGDLCIEQVDHTFPAIGVLPERAIAESDESAPSGMIDRVIDCWDEDHPQHLSWWTWEAYPRESTAVAYAGAGSASDIFDGLAITFRARLKEGGWTRGEVSFYAYCWTSGIATDGEMQITSTNPGAGADSVTQSGAIDEVPAWYLLKTKVDCTTDAEILVEIKRTAGAGTVYCSALSAVGNE